MKAVDPTIKIGVVLTTPGYWPDGVVGLRRQQRLERHRHVDRQEHGRLRHLPLLPGWHERGRPAHQAADARLDGDPVQGRHEQVRHQQPGRVHHRDQQRHHPVRHADAGAVGRRTCTSPRRRTGWPTSTGGTYATAPAPPRPMSPGPPTTVTAASSPAARGPNHPPVRRSPPTTASRWSATSPAPATRMVRATSGDAKLTVHAAKRANGNLDVLLINKDPNNSYQVNLSYTGYSPTAGVTVDSFTNRGTAIVTSTQGTATSQTIPPYSLVTVHLRPGGASQSPSTFTVRQPVAVEFAVTQPVAASHRQARRRVRRQAGRRRLHRRPAGRRRVRRPPPVRAPPRTARSAPGQAHSRARSRSPPAPPPSPAGPPPGHSPVARAITQLWNGTLTTSGSNVTVRNVSYNGSVGAGTSTTFGFLSNGTPSTPTISCTSP